MKKPLPCVPGIDPHAGEGGTQLCEAKCSTCGTVVPIKQPLRGGADDMFKRDFHLMFGPFLCDVCHGKEHEHDE